MTEPAVEILDNSRLRLDYPSNALITSTLQNLQQQSSDRLVELATRSSGRRVQPAASMIREGLKNLEPALQAYLKPVLEGGTPRKGVAAPSTVAPAFGQLATTRLVRSWAPLVDRSEERLTRGILEAGIPPAGTREDPALATERIAWVGAVRTLNAWTLVQALDYERLSARDEEDAALLAAHGAAQIGGKLEAHPLAKALDRLIELLPGNCNAPPVSAEYLRRKASDLREKVAAAKEWEGTGGMRKFLRLLRRAEERLIDAGYTRTEDRAWILTGIYYGTPWCLDVVDTKRHASSAFLGELKGVARSELFQEYTNHSGEGPDPRPILGSGLFASLQRSQDVSGVDCGHLLIGLYARTNAGARDIPVTGHEATGLEVVTWVGDLGGAAAVTAWDRVSNARVLAAEHFKGTDFGADSNLEGDVAAYVVAAPSTGKAPAAPRWPASGLVSDALAAYFLESGRRGRCKRFLEMQGATFAGQEIANLRQVRNDLLRKIKDFAGKYLLYRGLGSVELMRAKQAWKFVDKASADVTDRFLAWLKARLSS